MSRKPVAKKHNKKASAESRLAQVVTILATSLAVAYIVFRILSWVRFF